MSYESKQATFSERWCGDIWKHTHRKELSTNDTISVIGLKDATVSFNGIFLSLIYKKLKETQG